jgi:hypothetical protein
MDTITQDKKEEGQKPLIRHPAEYHIHIQGSLDISWSDRLSGMSVTTTGGKNLTALTTLRGELIDQSALLGVLNTLHDLGYAVLQVKYIAQSANANGGQFRLYKQP